MTVKSFPSYVSCHFLKQCFVISVVPVCMSFIKFVPKLFIFVHATINGIICSSLWKPLQRCRHQIYFCILILYLVNFLNSVNSSYNFLQIPYEFLCTRSYQLQNSFNFFLLNLDVISSFYSPNHPDQICLPFDRLKEISFFSCFVEYCQIFFSEFIIVIVIIWFLS